MKINVINVGHKVQEKDLKEYCDGLKKRISSYAKINDIICKNEKELKNILKKLKNVIILDVEGDSLNSNQFALLLFQDITFVIGPHDGFSENTKMELRKKYKFISLSNLTLPHRLCKAVLLEQIYRGFCINYNHPYAK